MGVAAIGAVALAVVVSGSLAGAVRRRSCGSVVPATGAVAAAMVVPFGFVINRRARRCRTSLVVDAVVAAASAAAAVVDVVTPQNCSIDLPAFVAASRRLRHGGTAGSFGFPLASPRRYALHKPSCAGPLTSGPWPPCSSSTASSSSSVEVVGASAAPPPALVDVAVVVGGLVVLDPVVDEEDELELDVVVSSSSSFCFARSPARSRRLDGSGSESPTWAAVFDTARCTGSGRCPVAAAAIPVDHSVTAAMIAAARAGTGTERRRRAGCAFSGSTTTGGASTGCEMTGGAAGVSDRTTSTNRATAASAPASSSAVAGPLAARRRALTLSSGSW